MDLVCYRQENIQIVSFLRSTGRLMTPFLSIVTPIYNSSKTLKPYLEGIFSSQFQDFELIIVDGLSDDSPKQFFKDYRIIYEQLDHRCGSADKRNRGIEIAKAQWVLFLDSDIVIPPTVLGDIVEVLKGHPSIAGLIGSYDDAPGGQNITSQFKFLFHHYTHQQEAQYVDSFWTGCGVIKKDVFIALGGFNAAFLDSDSVQDIELGYRLKKNKYRIYNAKHLQVKHLKVLNLWEWVYTDICIRGVPWIQVMLTYRDMSLKLNTNINGVASTLCVWAIVFLLGAVFFSGIFIYGAFILFGIFLAINWPLFKFLKEKKGFLFSAISTFYLFVYYFNCGICVLAGPFYYFKRNKRLVALSRSF